MVEQIPIAIFLNNVFFFFCIFVVVASVPWLYFVFSFISIPLVVSNEIKQNIELHSNPDTCATNTTSLFHTMGKSKLIASPQWISHLVVGSAFCVDLILNHIYPSKMFHIVSFKMSINPATDQLHWNPLRWTLSCIFHF